MAGWTDGWKDRWRDDWTDRWTDGWLDRCMDGWMNRWTDGRMDAVPVLPGPVKLIWDQPLGVSGVHGRGVQLSSSVNRTCPQTAQLERVRPG